MLVPAGDGNQPHVVRAAEPRSGAAGAPVGVKIGKLGQEYESLAASLDAIDRHEKALYGANQD